MMPAHLRGRVLLVALAATVAAVLPAGAQEECVAIRARRILPVCPDLPWEIEDGVIVVRNGRIAAIGADAEIPPGAKVIEFPFGTVIPGLVAAATDLGGRHRGDESIAAGYRAVDAFNRYGNYAETLSAGVTAVHLSPGSHRLLTGQGAVVKLGGGPSGRVLRPHADLTINLGPGVYRPPLDVTYSFPASADVPIPLPRRQRPDSAMGQWLGLEEAIRRALEGEQPEPVSLHGPALARAWQEGLPLRFHANRAADLLGAIRFLKKHKRRGYLVGGAEAEKVSEAIRDARLPLVYQPRYRFGAPGDNLGTDPDVLAAEVRDFRRLAGVTLALAPPAGEAA
ncbi:MAG TPA: hypothetical protein EYP56_03305, partial [Planctomycetaceae bacterium]|nr:hypothetical protein [Planctomycetaceae bacterium]